MTKCYRNKICKKIKNHKKNSFNNGKNIDAQFSILKINSKDNIDCSFKSPLLRSKIFHIKTNFFLKRTLLQRRGNRIQTIAISHTSF
jgi:hypothetical protein